MYLAVPAQHMSQQHIVFHATFAKLGPGRRTDEIVAESSLMHLDNSGMLADGIGGAPSAVRSCGCCRATEVQYLR